jgi:hypothetical protein
LIADGPETKEEFSKPSVPFQRNAAHSAISMAQIADRYWTVRLCTVFSLQVKAVKVRTVPIQS